MGDNANANTNSNTGSSCVKTYLNSMGDAVGGQRGWILRAAAEGGASSEIVIDHLLPKGLSAVVGALTCVCPPHL